MGKEGKKCGQALGGACGGGLGVALQRRNGLCTTMECEGLVVVVVHTDALVQCNTPGTKGDFVMRSCAIPCFHHVER